MLNKTQINWLKINNNALKMIKGIILKMWDESILYLHESANEEYCNLPIRLFRDCFKKYFDTTNIEFLSQNQAEMNQKGLDFLIEFNSELESELSAFNKTSELFEQSKEIILSEKKRKSR